MHLISREDWYFISVYSVNSVAGFSLRLGALARDFRLLSEKAINLPCAKDDDGLALGR